MLIEHRGKIALRGNNFNISYSDLLKQISLFSDLYQINKNERVVIFSENRLGWIYAFYSVWSKNGIVAPVDFLSSSKELAYIISDCKPSIIFTSEEKLEIVNEALCEIDFKPQVIVLNQYEIEQYTGSELVKINGSDEDTAVIIYTSGTTGKPKGVMLSFLNLKVNIEAVTNEIKILTHEDVMIMLLPLHHILPLLGTMIIPLYVGGQIAIAPSFKSEDIIQTLHDYKVSVIIGVPRLFEAILNGILQKIESSALALFLYRIAKQLNNKTLSKFLFKAVHNKFGGAVSYLVSGGAALPVEVAMGFNVLGFEVLEGYGMTEAAPIIAFNHPYKVHIGSVGFPLKRSDVIIKDGEIVVKGPNVMQGYFNRNQETTDVLRDGWLHTGDLGAIDKNGYLFITGRKKEIIVLSNGKNINPSLIESDIEKSSEIVKEIGVYQEGDRLAAVVVPEATKSHLLNGEDVYTYIKNEVLERYNNSVSAYKQILRLTIINGELPRTRLGKIKRFELKALQRKDNEPIDNHEIELEEFHIVKRYLEKEKKCTVLAHHHIEYDLALDSLDKVALQVFLQSTFGVDIEVSQLAAFQSILKLSEELHKLKTKVNIEEISWAEVLKIHTDLKLPHSSLLGRWGLKILGLGLRSYLRIDASGLENIPASPCIFVANHQSFIDALFITTFIKSKVLRNTFFYAKEKHVSKRWLKFLARKNNVIVMDLSKDLKQSIQKLGEVLKMGKKIVIFPEGTRSKDGRLGEFKKTFAILSRELNVPIVPIAINGAYQVLPSGSTFPKPFKKVSVSFLETVFSTHLDYDQLTTIVADKINHSLLPNNDE